MVIADSFVLSSLWATSAFVFAYSPSQLSR